MDSIPLLALFFKLFNSKLPETFQYFGIYVMCCFILQTYAGVLIFSLYRKRDLIVYIQTIFLSFSPIMIERAFRHTSLASHYLVLFALYIFLRAKKRGHSNYDYFMLVLIALCILIHPYFLPMVFGLLVSDIIDMVYFERRLKQAVLLLFVSACIILHLSYSLGILGQGINLVQGYGMFTMNLNALFNPVSTNIMKTGSLNSKYEWSSILPVLPQINGNYDGFNYLGFGIILLWVIIGTYVVVKTFKLEKRKRYVSFVRKYMSLFLILIVFSCYAVSNCITWNDFEFQIPIPECINRVCSIFAASGRVFWPVYYSLTIFALVFGTKLIIEKTKSVKWGTVTLVAILAIQIYDMRDIIVIKHSYFSQFDGECHTNAPYDFEYNNDLWEYIEDNYSNVWILNQYRSVGYGLAANCAKRGLLTNYMASNRFSNEQMEMANRFSDKVRKELTSGELEYDSVYILNGDEDIQLYKNIFNDQAIFVNTDDLFYYTPYVVMLPKKR